jgi:hypothetical protein
VKTNVTKTLHSGKLNLEFHGSESGGSFFGFYKLATTFFADDQVVKQLISGLENILAPLSAFVDPNQMSISFSKKKGPEGPFSILANFWQYGFHTYTLTDGSEKLLS